MSSEPRSRDDFHIAIICALTTECDAVALIFDQFYDENSDRFGRAVGDKNHYRTGRIGKYNVVLVSLPHMGKVPAAVTAASIRSSYPVLQLALLVGICGGVPFFEREEILLGDVIVSKQVVQYDFGRFGPDGFEMKNTVEDNLGRATTDIRNLVAWLKTASVQDLVEGKAAEYLVELQAKAGKSKKRQFREQYKCPGTLKDKLHEGPEWLGDGLDHDAGNVIQRERLEEKRKMEQNQDPAVQNPSLWIGIVASGDMVIKSAHDRDRIAKNTGAIAFEMEGAGIWDEVPCIVVKGVCDYADSHKNKEWQSFAAATAAATAKAILGRYVQTDSNESRGGQGSTSRSSAQEASGVRSQQTCGGVGVNNFQSGKQ